MPGAAHRQRQTLDIWPGFVDALAAVLMIVVFLVMIFTVSQFFLGNTLSSQNLALDRLRSQVDELARTLALERSESARLREDLARTSADLRLAASERDRLSGLLAEASAERDTLRRDLDQERSAAAGSAALLEDAREALAENMEKLALQAALAEQLRRDIAALREARDALEQEVAGMAAAARERERDLATLRDRSRELEARLADERERTALAQKEARERAAALRGLGGELADERRRRDDAERRASDLDRRLAELARRAALADERLGRERRLGAGARAQVDFLNRQVAALRDEIARLAGLLEESEEKARRQGVMIADLGRRLNAALASKVHELQRYRSEFFGRLREALGGIAGVRVVGDRFVLQAEVLFPPGSDELNPDGRDHIARLAGTLADISRRIPDDLDWVLRVDGHADRTPIETPRFPSNWELSTARAVAVVKQLTAHGLPAERLAAAGFGEFHPIDHGITEGAYRRNRRIEFKLTQR